MSFSFLRRLRFGAPIIVVSGLPRSGTSMAMKMLDAVGLPMVVDNKREADIDNPKGYYEDERVMNISATSDKGWLKECHGKVVKIVAPLLPHLPPNHNYKVVYMDRHIEEVLASQAKMLERRGETHEVDDQAMREMYTGHVDKVKFLLRYRPQFDWIELHYSDVLADPKTAVARLNAFLGGHLDERKMAEVVDPDLYRNRVAADVPN